MNDAAAGNYGAFVTLKQANKLRGCKGFPEPVAELRLLVEAAAVDAALHDHRFPPLSTAELETTTLSTTILSAPTPVDPAPLAGHKRLRSVHTA
ncbi:MAG: AMMECR1 domain-containing protein [Salinarchaeum sp.]